MRLRGLGEGPLEEGRLGPTLGKAGKVGGALEERLGGRSRLEDEGMECPGCTWESEQMGLRWQMGGSPLGYCCGSFCVLRLLEKDSLSF